MYSFGKARKWLLSHCSHQGLLTYDFHLFYISVEDSEVALCLLSCHRCLFCEL